MPFQFELGLVQQVFLAIRQHLFLKGCAPNGAVFLIERVHRMLDIGLINLVEEILDAVIVAIVVDNDEPYEAGCDKGGHKPLVKFVH